MLDLLTLAKNLDASKLSTYEIIIGAVLIVTSLLIIFVVLLQEGRQSNVGVISGAAESFMDKGAAKSLDQKLSKWTKVIAVVFFLLVLGGMMISKFLTNDAMLRSEREKNQATATSQSAQISSTPSSVTTTTTTITTTTTTTKPVENDKDEENKNEENKNEENSSESAE